MDDGLKTITKCITLKIKKRTISSRNDAITHVQMISSFRRTVNDFEI